MTTAMLFSICLLTSSPLELPVGGLSRKRPLSPHLPSNTTSGWAIRSTSSTLHAPQKNLLAKVSRYQEFIRCSSFTSCLFCRQQTGAEIWHRRRSRRVGGGAEATGPRVVQHGWRLWWHTQPFLQHFPGVHRKERAGTGGEEEKENVS